VASIGWEESYLGRLRSVAGDRVLLFVGARGVIRDGAGRVLLIRRSDNGLWALPAGALEVGESLADCAVREVYEETGLTATELIPFAMFTGPRYISTNQWGNTYQLHSTAFRVDAWHGELARVTDETTDARFFDPAALPEECAASVPETLADLASFEATGQFVLH
jgi:8-oxo-dGTP pyrophosphatase MutT (NUDIX family)